MGMFIIFMVVMAFQKDTSGKTCQIVQLKKYNLLYVNYSSI